MNKNFVEYTRLKIHLGTMVLDTCSSSFEASLSSCSLHPHACFTKTLKRISCDQKLSFEYLLLGKKVYLHVIGIENDDVSIHEEGADDNAGFYCCYATKVLNLCNTDYLLPQSRIRK